MCAVLNPRIFSPFLCFVFPSWCSRPNRSRLPDMLKYLRDNSLTIDLETMNPVEMPKRPDAKMEAFFPYPAADMLAKHSLGAQPKPSEFADAMIVSTSFVEKPPTNAIRFVVADDRVVLWYFVLLLLPLLCSLQP